MYVEVNNNAMLYIKRIAATHFLAENVIKLDYFRVLELDIRGGIKDGKKTGYIYIYAYVYLERESYEGWKCIRITVKYEVLVLRITCRVYRIKGLENTCRICNVRVTDTTVRVPLTLLQFHTFPLDEFGVISLALSPLFPTNTDGKT